MRNTVGFALAVTILLGFLGSVSTSLPGDDPKAPVYKPVIPVHDLMEAVEESYEMAAEQLKEKKYSKARTSAYLVAELMNVLQHHSSEEVQGEENLKKWKEISMEIRDRAAEAGAAAKKKDGDAALAILKKLEDSCERCHDMRE